MVVKTPPSRYDRPQVGKFFRYVLKIAPYENNPLYDCLRHASPPLQWYIQKTCATEGIGLYDGLDWLSQQLQQS